MAEIKQVFQPRLETDKSPKYEMRIVIHDENVPDLFADKDGTYGDYLTLKLRCIKCTLVVGSWDYIGRSKDLPIDKAVEKIFSELRPYGEITPEGLVCNAHKSSE